MKTAHLPPGRSHVAPGKAEVNGKTQDSGQTKDKPTKDPKQAKDKGKNGKPAKGKAKDATPTKDKLDTSDPVDEEVNKQVTDAGRDDGQMDDKKSDGEINVGKGDEAGITDQKNDDAQIKDMKTDDGQLNGENSNLSGSKTDDEHKIGDNKSDDKGHEPKRTDNEGQTIENGTDEGRTNVFEHINGQENDLVRHLLPHMSPALLPHVLDSHTKTTQDSPSKSSPITQSDLDRIRTNSLNVIRESSEGSDDEDDEAPAPPPPVMPSGRRHSFHHFPAPPTKSQTKKAAQVRALLQEVEEEELEKISKKLGEKTVLVRQHLGHVEDRLFEMFGDKEKQTINVNKFLMGLTATGMRPSDPRLQQTRKNLKKVQEQLGNEFMTLDVSYDTFMGIISENLEVVVKAFSASFVIPDFQGFCRQVESIYNNCLSNDSGTPAQYIPQLARYTSKYWGMSVCTVDGQRFSLGEVDTPFTIQSCSKPLTYAVGLGLNGTDYMHQYVGMEPSGRYFNDLVLDYGNKPHNPMINAGAIMTAALIKPELSAADRFDYMFKVYKRLTGDEHLGFNNSVFLSERECADRNFALAYFMRENKCFPEGTKLQETLDFYFQLCSLEITADSGAVIAATLANGGLNPLTGDPVLTVDAVRNTLTLMHSCGMYNYSGQFAFQVGLPAKSGVSGCVLLVIPNTMGICLWSPPLDANGNSCRGVQFCMEMVSRFNFHNFDNLRGFSTSKHDPRTAKTESKAQVLFDLLFSAAAGDLSALRRHMLSGTDMQTKDYDGRTALHVATSEGHHEIVEFLLNSCQVYPLPKDRWERTPLDDAESFDHPQCVELLVGCCKKKGIEIPESCNGYLAIDTS